jgi:hypothetical protein
MELGAADRLRVGDLGAVADTEPRMYSQAWVVEGP